MSKCDPELKNTAGVGAIYQDINVTNIQPTTEHLHGCIDNGRFAIVAIHLPDNVMLYVANAYGWTRGSWDDKAAQRTSDLLEAIIAESATLPPGPRIIFGNLNADPENLPSLQAALDGHDFVDLGVHDAFDHPTLQPTCFPCGDGTPY